MIPSKDLFQLIRSLGQTEKAYFKKHSFSEKENQYLLLFDAIEKQRSYDEEKIRRKFKGRAFVRQLPVAKNYLYSRILTSLDAYHNSNYETLRRGLHHAEILYEKGLYDQSLKLVRRVKKTALLYDIRFYLPEILHWENRIAREKHDFQWMKKTVDEYKQEIRLSANEQAFAEIASKINVFVWQYGEEKGAKDFAEVEKIMKNPILKKESNALTLSAKNSFYYLHGMYWYLKENYHKAYFYFEKEFFLYHNHPEKINSNLSTYTSCISNLVAVCLKIKNYSQYEKYLDAVKNATSLIKKRSFRARLFFVYANGLLDYLLLIGEYDRAKKSIPDTFKEFGLYERELNQHEKAVLYINVAIIWFGNEEYKKSLFYLNKIRNELRENMHPDVERFLNIFYIMAHYEAKHFDLLPGLAQSAHRLLDKEKRGSKFESLLLKFFSRGISKANTRKKQAEAFMQLKKELLPLVNDKNEKKYFAFFDYFSWVKSKIENRPFAAVVREKAGA